MNGLMQIYSQ